jgi:hypothetical protein
MVEKFALQAHWIIEVAFFEKFHVKKKKNEKNMDKFMVFFLTSPTRTVKNPKDQESNAPRSNIFWKKWEGQLKPFSNFFMKKTRLFVGKNLEKFYAFAKIGGQLAGYVPVSTLDILGRCKRKNVSEILK